MILTTWIEIVKGRNSYSRSGHAGIMGCVKHDRQGANGVPARLDAFVKEAGKF